MAKGKQTISSSLPKSIVEFVKNEAKRIDMSQSYIVRIALEQYMKTIQKGKL